MSKPNIQVDVSVVIRRHDTVLVMQRPEDDHNFPLHWGIPGGGFELTDSSIEDAARREVYEEVGLTLGKLRFVESHFVPERNVLFVVLTGRCDQGEAMLDPKEVAAIQWATLQELDDNRKFTPETLRIIRDVYAS